MSDERALEVMKEMKSIKPEHWNIIKKNLEVLKGFVDVDASGAVQSMFDGLSETMTLKFSEILAPLKNEWNALLDTLLAPLIPMLSGLVEFLVPIIKVIAEGVQWLIDLSWLPPPPEEGVMMTMDQFVQDYMQRYPLTWQHPGFFQQEYAKYVAEWKLLHPPPTRTGGYQI